MERADRLRDRGEVTHRHAADALLERAGDFVMVYRGVPRSMVLQCPDGCGEVLTINLDPRTDKAWRFYRKRRQISIFPSVWRDTGCLSHFIVWNHRLLWCGGRDEDDDTVVEEAEGLRDRVLSFCTRDWRHYTELADRLEEVPWDVHRACRQLAYRSKLLLEREGKERGFFKMAEHP